MLFRIIFVLILLFSIALSDVNWVELPHSVEINQGSFLSQDVEVTTTAPGGMASWTSTGGRYIGIEFYGFNGEQTVGRIRIIAPPIGGWFGTEAIQIIPADNSGAQNPVTIYVTVKYVNTPPEITLMEPCEELISDTNVVFRWAAVDPDPFDELLYQVHLDGTLIYTGYSDSLFFEGLTYGKIYKWVLIVHDGQNEARDTCEFTVVPNTPPSAPQISGVLKGIINQNYSINLSTTDAENHPVQYRIDWGDGQTEDWSALVSPEANQLFEHTWQQAGQYTITTWAKDKFGAESAPSQFNVEIIETGLYVITPHPGEVFEAFDETQIEVMLAGLTGNTSDCELYLSTNNGNSWSRIQKNELKLLRKNDTFNNDIDTLKFNWTIPDNISSNQCLIKAIWIPAPENSSISGQFAIYPQRSITVTYPNGGEVIQGNVNNTVTWNWTGLIDKVDLFYSLNGGVTYILIDENVDNTGNYQWATIDTNSRYCRIKIQQTNAPELSDQSNSNFQIYNNWLQMMDPDSSSTIEMSKTYYLKWNYNGIIENVSLKYISPSDTVTITNSIEASKKMVNWTVPSNLNSTDSARIIIQGVNFQNITDTSDYFRLIPKKQVTLLSPNGGEYIFIDSVYQIRFLSTFGIQSIRLDYWNNNRWNLIKDNINPTNGAYDWEIPDEEMKSCFVKITADSEVSDTSDKAFSISKPLDLSITHPTADTLTAGTIDSLTWNSQGLIDYVKINLQGNDKDSSIILNNTGKTEFNLAWYNGNLMLTLETLGLPNGLSYSTSKNYTVRLPSPEITSPIEDSIVINAGDAVYFSSVDFSEEGITYYWNFGNGTEISGTDTEPGYIDYFSAGTKTVKHWYKVNGFSSDTVEKIVKVNPLPQSEILNPLNDTTYLKLFAEIDLEGKSYDRQNVEYFWTYGKEDTLNGLIQENISYNQAGIYEIIFWYKYNSIVAEADRKIIIVNDLEPAKILTPAADTLIKIHDSLYFTGSEYEGTEENILYEWIFSDDLIIQSQNPEYVTFDSPGLYNVQYHYIVNGTESQGDIRKIQVFQPVEANLIVLDTTTSGPCETSVALQGILQLTGTGDIITKEIKIDGEPIPENSFTNDSAFSIHLETGSYQLTAYVIDEYNYESKDTLNFDVIIPQDSINIGFIYNGNYLGLDSLAVNKNDQISVEIAAAFPENFIIFMGNHPDSLRKLTETSDSVYDLPLSFMVPGNYYIQVVNEHSCLSMESNILKFRLNDTSVPVNEISVNKPITTTLYANYPNPFNPETTIKFYIPKSEHVELTVYNISGQKISTLVNENMQAGFHEISFNAAPYPSGIYFYYLKTSNFIDKKKMMFLK